MTLTIRVLEDGDQGLLGRVEAGVLDREAWTRDWPTPSCAIRGITLSGPLPKTALSASSRLSTTGIPTNRANSGSTRSALPPPGSAGASGRPVTFDLPRSFRHVGDEGTNTKILVSPWPRDEPWGPAFPSLSDKPLSAGESRTKRGPSGNVCKGVSGVLACRSGTRRDWDAGALLRFPKTGKVAHSGGRCLVRRLWHLCVPHLLGLGMGGRVGLTHSRRD